MGYLGLIFLLLLILGLSLVQLIALALIDHRMRRGRLDRCITSTGKKTKDVASQPMSLRAGEILRRMAAVTAERVSVVKGDEAETSAALLKSAGIRSRDAHLIYAFLKLVLPVAAVILSVLWLSLNSEEGVKPLTAIVVVCATALVLSRAPDAVLSHKRKRRLDKVRRNFPDMLELLVITSEAGLAPVPALGRVARELYAACPDLAIELQQLVVELGVLPEREQAWRNLEERLPLPEVSVFANAMAQAGRYGTPFRGALRSLMLDARAQRLLRLEEQAGRLPALMTVPLILFIMPALFIVLIGPAALSILDNLMKGGA